LQKGIVVLVLSRRVEETIWIGDDIRITILGIRGNQIRLGVDAPKEIKVHREEVYQRIQHGKLPSAPDIPTVPPVPAVAESPDFQIPVQSACGR